MSAESAPESTGVDSISVPVVQETPSSNGFADLGLPPAIVRAVGELGYETPTPIQAATIPSLLNGRDVLGQAQTGTGKTAAFALPLLARINPSVKRVQVLVLAPTRELAMQVAEAFTAYGRHLGGLSVAAIYGGSGYGPQLTALRRGAQVVVGTPGRVIDHLEQGNLKLDGAQAVVLDEADEMLRMGFIDDVEKVLEAMPSSKQVALFSATMPPAIKRIADLHLKNADEVAIAAKTRAATTVRQRVWMAQGMGKQEALERVLEVEPFEACIIFARTKQGTEEIANALQSRGFAAAALNGDIPQTLRERTVQRLKDGDLRIVVATDVAARGLDVERITHVLNFDVPSDPESYVHRIGRTGRAGRSGEAILFIAPRERGLLKLIERVTRSTLDLYPMPTRADVQSAQQARLGERLKAVQAAAGDRLARAEAWVTAQGSENLASLAAALAVLAAGKEAMFDTLGAEPAAKKRPAREEYVQHGDGDSPRESRARTPFAERGERSERPERAERAPRANKGPEAGMETYRVEVGYRHNIRPGNLVGAIANEADLDSSFIGRIDIRDDHSYIDLPEGMPEQTFLLLKNVWVGNQQLKLSKLDGLPPPKEFRPRDDRFGGGDERPRSFKKPFAPRSFGDRDSAPRRFDNDGPRRSFDNDGSRFNRESAPRSFDNDGPRRAPSERSFAPRFNSDGPRFNSDGPRGPRGPGGPAGKPRFKRGPDRD